MQRTAIFLTLIFAIFSVQAKAEKGFLIKTTFEYQTKAKTMKSEASFILDAQNHGWTNLTKPKDGVALLGRMVKADAKSLHMEYMVIDTNQANAIATTTGIIALLKEPASIGIDGHDGGKVTVGILASPTDYTASK